MKKMIMLVVCLTMMGIQSVKMQAASVATVALHHEGNVTLYNADQLKDAVEAAEAGDKIFLTEGMFKGNFNFSKDISIIGSGQNTVIQGYIHFEDQLTLTDYALDGLVVTGINNGDADALIEGLKIRRCKVEDFVFSNTNPSPVPNIIVEDCLFISFYTRGYSGKVINSKIGHLNGSDSYIAFANCNINIIQHSQIYVYFYNCIISGRTYDASITSCFFQNCLIGSFSGSNNTYSGCYKLGENLTLTDDYDYTVPAEYVGDDGTEVGIHGGALPFTLEPVLPRVKEHSLQVDAATRQLKVNLKVGVGE